MAIFKSKTVTKDGRKWYFSICYLTANGERKRKKSQLYITKQEAQDAERQFLMERTNTNRVDITFEELYKSYIEHKKDSIKGSTKYCKDKRVKNDLLPYFGKMNIHNIEVTTIMGWMAKTNNTTYCNGKKYFSSYKNILLNDLKSILKHGVKFYELKQNVANNVTAFHEKNENIIADEEKIKYITPDEYNLFISVIGNIVFKTFFAFLYYMGVRKGEAQALTWEDIFLETDQVRIIKTITIHTNERDEFGNKFNITNTKNRKNRTIKVPKTLKEMLLELYEYYKKAEGFTEKWYIFGGYKYLNSTAINNEKDRYFNLVEKTYGKPINRITNHEFRHSHASYLISQGVKIERIAYRLGDTVGVVLKTYAHLFPEAEDEVIDTLNSI